MKNINKIDYHKFVDEELQKKGFYIKPVTQEYINIRLNDIMKFVNGVLNEYKNVYKSWDPKPKNWFLNPMNEKWNYSFVIENNSGDIALLNFSSIYENGLRNHCTFVGKKFRGENLAKLHMIKLCLTGLDNGFQKYDGYWYKGNSGSIILHLKMGFKIESMRNNEELLLVGYLQKIKEETYKLYIKNSSSSK